ncbi:ferredoxin--NADP reductase [Arundinibacter roseus]|uniref:Ferredoxin--NADP reductase n=1 Tax=Arundinibacter roseus TaxID=2070510 RepID=A0A4R4KH93_9BACT|nr:ferredoxin--NADP reductase [Arundinibacter roseus]TDB65949.1 ferredoxin--NADP reductase [Arundinibacter roseus]
MFQPTHTFSVYAINQETADTRTYILKPMNPPEFLYTAGQFLTFLLNVHGHEVRRSYSLSSAPGLDELPAVTVKRISNGEISRFWHDSVQVGTQLTALPAAGRFAAAPADAKPRDLFLLGAGSGITPLFSILKHTLVHEPNTHVILLYANRHEREVIFQKELNEWQTHFSEQFTIRYFMSQPSDDWPGLRGRINNYRLENEVRQQLRYDLSKAQFLICGPFELMRTAEITLRFMGVEEEQIRKENFVIVAQTPPPPLRSQAHAIELRHRGQVHTINVPAFTTILQAGLSHGIPIPYSCKGGRCSACAAQCRAGKVRMSINDVLTARDLSDGWILTCTAYPESDDVLIELP